MWKKGHLPRIAEVVNKKVMGTSSQDEVNKALESQTLPEDVRAALLHLSSVIKANLAYYALPLRSYPKAGEAILPILDENRRTTQDLHLHADATGRVLNKENGPSNYIMTSDGPKFSPIGPRPTVNFEAFLNA